MRDIVKQDLIERRILLLRGLIVSRTVLENLNRPREFIPFHVCDISKVALQHNGRIKRNASLTGVVNELSMWRKGCFFLFLALHPCNAAGRVLLFYHPWQNDGSRDRKKQPFLHTSEGLRLN